MALFDSKNQPKKRRGRNKDALLMEALRERFEGGEKDFYKHLIDLAIGDGKSKKANAQLMAILANRIYPQTKAVGPKVCFNYDPSKAPSQQVDDTLKAASEGELTLDAANAIVSMIQSKLKIKELDEFEARIALLEEQAKSQRVQ